MRMTATRAGDAERGRDGERVERERQDQNDQLKGLAGGPPQSGPSRSWERVRMVDSGRSTNAWSRSSSLAPTGSGSVPGRGRTHPWCCWLPIRRRVSCRRTG
jgi:hypothetical protein